MTDRAIKRRFRLYVDESGDHTYKQLEDYSRRYLALSGVAIEHEYYRSSFHPELLALKQSYFPHSPDDPLVLHRRDIVDRKGLFGLLRDPKINSDWERDLLQFTMSAEMRLFTIVIDKKSHIERYGDSAQHPYHLAMAFLLERYKGFLNWKGAQGDVLAESRGGTQDRNLKKAYQQIWESGTYYHSAGEFQGVLTSKQLKIKPKTDAIAGLELADLIVHPSKMEMLRAFGCIAPGGTGFGVRYAEGFRKHYDLYGRKLLR